MRHIFFLILVLHLYHVTGQSSEVVAKDYTKVLFKMEGATAVPVTDIRDENNVSFFITGRAPRQLLISNKDQSVYVWIHQRMIKRMESSQLLRLDSTHLLADTTYITLTTPAHFAELVCYRIDEGDAKVVLENLPKAKEQLAGWQNFMITAILLITGMLSLLATTSRGHFSALFKQAWLVRQSVASQDLKIADINLLLAASIVVVAFAFFVLVAKNQLAPQDITYATYMALWARYILLGIVFIAFKLIWTFLAAILFEMKHVRNRLIVSYITYFFVLILPLVFVFLVVEKSYLNLLSEQVTIVFTLLMILFAVIMLVRFIDQSNQAKLPFIAYLCATEFLPSIILIFWFFK